MVAVNKSRISRGSDNRTPRNLEKKIMGDAVDYDDIEGGVAAEQNRQRVRNVANSLGDVEGGASSELNRQRLAETSNSFGDFEGGVQQTLNRQRARAAAQANGTFDSIPGRLNPATTSIASTPSAPNDIKLLTGGLADGSERPRGSVSALDNTTISQSRGQPVNSSGGIKVQPLLDDLTVPDNVLLDHLNLQYHIVLSLVPAVQVALIQAALPRGAQDQVDSFDSLRRAIVQQGSVPFASTGDVFQVETTDVFDIVGENDELIEADDVFVGKKNYYNVESLTFENVMAPSSQNQFINAMLTGKIVLVEPHGFRFREDITRIGNAVGYQGINPGRFLHRLDIFFSGYDQDTGEWVPFIDLDVRVGKTKVLTYYINFTTVEAKIDHTGTTYDISYAPSGHAAYRPEEIVVNSGAIATGDRSKSETFGGFLNRIAQSMDTAVSERTHQQVKRKYKFTAPPELLDAPFFSGDFAFKKGFISNDPKKGSFITPARDVNAIGIIEDALQDIPFVWKEFLKVEDKKHVNPRIHWGIHFNVIYDSSANPGTGDYDTITMEYFIAPFATYKNTRMNNRQDMIEVVDAKSQAARIAQMLRFGMIGRVYDYINTSENLEVIELDVSLKNFYYHTMYKPKPSVGNAGVSLVESSSNSNQQITVQNQLAKDTGTVSDEQANVIPRSQETSVASTLTRLFGRGVDSPSPSCDLDLFKTPFDINGGGYGEMPTSDFTSMVGASNQIERDEYKANLNDHIKNELLLINMQVRGDPIWLLTPYGVHSGITISTTNQANNATGVRAQACKCFFLRMFAPEQNDYMDPNRTQASPACTVIGGFYEILKVTSKFEGGKFTQNIEANKMTHLNYAETQVNVVPNSQVNTGPTPANTPAPQNNATPNDDAVPTPAAAITS